MPEALSSTCFHNSVNWPKYSLADFFKDPLIRKSYREAIINRYARSLASRYIQLSPDGAFGNASILNGIIREKFDQLPSGHVAVHLRVGDILEKSNISVTDRLSKGAASSYWAPLRPSFHVYSPPLSYYEAVVNELKERGEKSVVLVAGVRNSSNTVKSCQYVNRVASFFLRQGIVIKYRLGNAPDEDVAYLSRSRIFVPSGGGFSKMSSMLVRENGGHVLHATDDFCFDLFVPGGCPKDIQPSECCHASWTPPCCHNTSVLLWEQS